MFWYLWDYWEYLIQELDGISYDIVHQFRVGNQLVDFLALKGEAGCSIPYLGD